MVRKKRNEWAAGWIFHSALDFMLGERVRDQVYINKPQDIELHERICIYVEVNIE